MVAGALLAGLMSLSVGAQARPDRSSWCLGLKPTKLGTEGDDRLTGTDRRDVITGLGGDDVIEGLGGGDVVCAGAGNDAITGGDGHDILMGEAGDDEIRGEAGDDVQRGGPGADDFRDVDGRDTYAGGAGDDLMAMDLDDEGSDAFIGGAGSDTMIGIDENRDLFLGGEGDDEMSGHLSSGPSVFPYGAGDEVTYEASAAGVEIIPTGLDYSVSGEGSDTLHGFDRIIGSFHDDSITGNHPNDTIRGLTGNDRIDGGEGYDTIDGGMGDDLLDAGPQSGAVSFNDSWYRITASLVDGTSIGAGDDTLANFDSIYGTDFGDNIEGDDGPNTIYGGGGSNHLFGLGGDDEMSFGSEGSAGDGHDRCIVFFADDCEEQIIAEVYPSVAIDYPRTGDSGAYGVEGHVTGGFGPTPSKVFVAIRFLSDQGCMWDAEQPRVPYGIGSCTRPKWNEVEIKEDYSWSYPLHLRKWGNYEVMVRGDVLVENDAPVKFTLP